MSESPSFDPYYKWLGIPPDEQPPTHYRLLGLRQFEADPDVIESAADARMSHLRTFQTGKHGAISQQILNKVSAARGCLLNPQRRAEYDAQLQSQQLPPLDTPESGPFAAAGVLDSAPAPFPLQVRKNTLHRSGRRQSRSRPWLLPVALGGGSLAVLAIVLIIFSASGDGTPSTDSDVAQGDTTLPPASAIGGDTSPNPGGPPKIETTAIDGSVPESEMPIVEVQQPDQQTGTAFDVLLSAAEDALRRADLEEARQRLNEAESQAASPVQQQQLADALKLHAQLTKFWEGVAHGGKQFTRVSDFDIDGMTAQVVNSASNQLVLRVSGRSCRFFLDKPQTVPAALAVALAAHGGTPEEVIAAFQNLNPENPEREAQLWELAYRALTLRTPDPSATAQTTGGNNSLADLAGGSETSPSSVGGTGNDGQPNLGSLAQRKPVPSNDVLETKRSEVRQLLVTDYANAKQSATILALAKRLYDLGQQTHADDPDSSYVFFIESASLTADTGDARGALEMLDNMGRIYDDQRLMFWKADALERAAKSAGSAEQFGYVVEQGFLHVNEALKGEDVVAANKFIEAALAAARKLNDRKITALIMESSRELKVIEQQLAKIIAAREALELQPDDPEPNRAVGYHLCFVKQDWPQGLPHLAKSGDARLTPLATAELASPSSADQMLELADAWWQLAESAQSEYSVAIKHHAADWYRRAAPLLSGLLQAKAAKRTEDAHALGPATSVFVLTPQFAYLTDQPLLQVSEVWLPDGDQLHGPRKMGGRRYEHSIWAHPERGNVAGRVSYKLGKQFSELRGIAGISDGVPNPRAWSAIDFAVVDETGKVLWASRPLRERGESQAFQVTVRGVDTLHLLTKPKGTNTYCHAVWCDALLLK